MIDKLINKAGFEPSKTDECVFYKGKTIYLLYTDDFILAGPDAEEIRQIIEDIEKAKLEIIKEGDIQDFLGVNIDKKKDGTINLTQPHLIELFFNELRLDGDKGKNTKDTPHCHRSY